MNDFIYINDTNTYPIEFKKISHRVFYAWFY